MDINWKVVIAGFILAIILSAIIGMISWIFRIGILLPSNTGYFLAAVIVGYVIGENYMDGAVHGALIVVFGFIIGLIIGIFFLPLLLMAPGIFTLQNIINTLTLISIPLMISILIGGIGGAIGVYLKKPNKIKYKITIKRPIFSENTTKNFKELSDSIEQNVAIFLKSFLNFIIEHLNAFLNGFIFNKSKYKPKDHFVCEKCNSYYQIQSNKLSEDFLDTCKCGGQLKHLKK